MHKLLRSSFVLAFGFVTAASTASADNWPQWRGAKHDGISTEKNLPTKWSKSEGVAWRLPLPGPAGATPVVWGDRIFLTSLGSEADGEADAILVLCVSTDGKLLWKKKLGSGSRPARGDEGNYASPSPSTDGQHVWAFCGSGDLACYDFDGREVWHFNVQDRYGKFSIQFGMSSTPVLDGDRLYLQLIHGEGNAKTREAVVVALDKATGKEIWKQPRPSEAYAENEHSYASPTLYRDGKLEFLLTHGADYVIAHRLTDGGEIWRSAGLNAPLGDSKYNPTLRLVASPLAVPGLIVVPSAKNGPVLGLRPDGKGDITNDSSARLWTRPQNTPDVPSPLVVDGLVYLCRENGNLIVLDAKTGEEVYEKPTARGRHRASPVFADGKVYLIGRDKGIINVVKAGREFELLASNEMDEAIAASLAISNGRIYIRSFEALYAIGAK
jgi:outer membrane protein assembly factor BamB